jgi:hypothetical protein
MAQDFQGWFRRRKPTITRVPRATGLPLPPPVLVVRGKQRRHSGLVLITRIVQPPPPTGLVPPRAPLVQNSIRKGHRGRVFVGRIPQASANPPWSPLVVNLRHAGHRGRFVLGRIPQPYAKPFKPVIIKGERRKHAGLIRIGRIVQPPPVVVTTRPPLGVMISSVRQPRHNGLQLAVRRPVGPSLYGISWAKPCHYEVRPDEDNQRNVMPYDDGDYRNAKPDEC